MTEFTAYDYLTCSVPQENAAFYLDCYQSFGWQQDEHFAMKEKSGSMQLKLKRSRSIANKAELTRLKRNFEADMQQLADLEKRKTSRACMAALAVGIVGTAFMAGSVFAVTATPPQTALCVLLAVPAFAGWIAPYFLYNRLKARHTQKILPYIEKKQDEIYALCEKGQSLL